MSYSRNVERTEIKVASLQSRLDEFKKAFESGAPPYNAPHEAIETMHRATADLKASGIEAHALKVGDRAPSFTLFNQDHVQCPPAIFSAKDRWWSVSSAATGDPTATWNWKLYSKSMGRSEH
jgi:hypothetical protein